MSSRSIDLIGVVAAVVTWAAVGAAGLAGLGIRPDVPLWWLGYAGYALVLLPLCLSLALPRRLVHGLLAAQFALGLVCFTMFPFGPTGVALVLTAIMLASHLPIRVAFLLVGAQTGLGMLGGILLNPEEGYPQVATICIVYLGFQLFAFLMVLANRKEVAAREAAERARAALARAQAQLAARSRDEERLRIARDLHDTLGHQLTALALNLEVLAHTAAPPADEQARNCRDLAKEVLGQVREVVGQLREPRQDLAARIAELVPALPRPHLALDLDPDLGVLTPAQVDAVARLVQEALTNSAKHSDAATLTVQVRAAAQRIQVRAHDDGAGRPRIVPGNGLRGMAERFTALGGRAAWSGEDGFTIEAQLPTTVPVGVR